MIQEQTLPEYYRELELDPAASADTIRAAYVSLAKRYHPDRNPGPAAAARMQRVNEAFAVLGNEAKRRLYDAQRAKAGLSVAQNGTNGATEPRPRYHPGYDSPPEPPRTGWTGSDAWRTPEARGRAVLGQRWRLGVAGYALLALFGVAVAAATLALLGAIPALSPHRSTPAASVMRPRATGSATPLASPSAPSQAASLHATDVIVGAATHFAHVEHLTEASHKVTSAARAWTFDVDGCSVFDGEYDTPALLNDAQAYWNEQHVRYQAAGDVVVAISQCDTPSHELAVSNQIGDILSHSQ